MGVDAYLHSFLMSAQDVCLYSTSVSGKFPIVCAGQKAVFGQSLVLLVWRSDEYLFHCIVNETRIYHRLGHTYSSNKYQMCTKMLNAFSP